MFRLILRSFPATRGWLYAGRFRLRLTFVGVLGSMRFGGFDAVRSSMYSLGGFGLFEFVRFVVFFSLLGLLCLSGSFGSLLIT